MVYNCRTSGIITLEDAGNGGGEQRINTGDRNTRARFSALVRHSGAELNRTLRGTTSTYFALRTEENYLRLCALLQAAGKAPRCAMNALVATADIHEIAGPVDYSSSRHGSSTAR